MVFLFDDEDETVPRQRPREVERLHLHAVEAPDKPGVELHLGASHRVHDADLMSSTATELKLFGSESIQPGEAKRLGSGKVSADRFDVDTNGQCNVLLWHAFAEEPDDFLDLEHRHLSKRHVASGKCRRERRGGGTFRETEGEIF